MKHTHTHNTYTSLHDRMPVIISSAQLLSGPEARWSLQGVRKRMCDVRVDSLSLSEEGPEAESREAPGLSHSTTSSPSLPLERLLRAQQRSKKGSIWASASFHVTHTESLWLQAPSRYKMRLTFGFGNYDIGHRMHALPSEVQRTPVGTETWRIKCQAIQRLPGA